MDWQDQIALMQEQICKGFTRSEFEYFCNVAKSLGLNPLAREIFAVGRWDKKLGREVMTIQISIDGQRLVAERSGVYQGQQCPLWCGPDGQWVDVWLHQYPPSAAKVGVWRDGFREPLIRVALWEEYVQRGKDGNPAGLWQKMPALMLAKCAESQALRAAFPSKLAGLYTQEEMGQSQILIEQSEQKPALTSAPENQLPASSVISEAQRKRLFAIVNEMQADKSEFRNWLLNEHGIESTSEIPKDAYDSIIATIQSGIFTPVTPDYEGDVVEAKG